MAADILQHWNSLQLIRSWHFYIRVTCICIQNQIVMCNMYWYIETCILSCSCGLMDKALVFGTRDCGFKSHQEQFCKTSFCNFFKIHTYTCIHTFIFQCAHYLQHIHRRVHTYASFGSNLQDTENLENYLCTMVYL